MCFFFNVQVWDFGSGHFVRSMEMPHAAQRTLCLCVVIIRSQPKQENKQRNNVVFVCLLKSAKSLLVGSDGAVVCMDAEGKRARVLLEVPEEAEVLHICATGFNNVCAALRRKNADSGFVCSWTF